MKRLLIIISLLITLAFVFAACGGETATTPVPAATPTPAPITDASTPVPSPANDFDADRVIAVFTREDGSGTRDAFVSITGVGDDMYNEAGVESDTAGIVTKVENNPYAIGYISVGSLNDRVKALSINGVSPSDDTIMSGAYTLQRPLLICINGDSEQNDLVQDFIKFMLSAQGQAISATRWTMVDPNAPDYTSSGLIGTLKIGGSTSVEPLMQPLRQAYIDINPGIEIEISGGGSGTGISEATSGVIDIGMSSRALRDGEREALTAINIALDGVAVIVNPDNPITEMSIVQVKDIFTGAVTRWSGVE